MGIIRELKEKNISSRELLLVGDVVTLVDSPLDRLKKGAKGKIAVIFGDIVDDPGVLMTVNFKVNGVTLPLTASAERFRFSKHAKDEELPDAGTEVVDVDGLEETN